MDIINTIEHLINELGFPIVMVGYFIFDKCKTTRPILNATNNMTTWLQIVSKQLDISPNESGDLSEKK